MKSTYQVIDGNELELSTALSEIGAKAPVIWEELAAAGLARPSAVARAVYEQLAGSDDAIRSLHQYWVDYARERLSELTGPVNILKGSYSRPFSYRSSHIETLRANALFLPANPESPSPQIEPTIKRFSETLFVDGSVKDQAVREGVRVSREDAEKIDSSAHPGFPGYPPPVRLQLLRERYLFRLSAAGFKLTSGSKKLTVVQSPIFDQKYEFALVDNSLDGLAAGMLNVKFAITEPGVNIKASQPFDHSLAVFSPDDIVPQFGNACLFEPGSYSQFMLACDAVAGLTLVLQRHLEHALQHFRMKQAPL